MTSILTTIKKMLGIEEDQTAFDSELIVYINAVFLGLNQLGIGPVNGIQITSKTETWSLFAEDQLVTSAVKSYIYLKVKIPFDPPASTVVDSMKSQISELEWRLISQKEKDIIWPPL